MVKDDKAVPIRSGVKNWMLIGTLGLLALGAGLVLPQLMPSSMPVAEAAPVVDRSLVPEKAPANDLAYIPPAWPEAPDSKAMLVRLALGTVVVLGLCVGTLWVLKRCVRGKALPGVSGSQLRVLETLPLGNRCSIYLLSAGRSQVLAGVDGSGLKALVALPEHFENALNEIQAETTSPPLAA